MKAAEEAEAKAEAEAEKAKEEEEEAKMKAAAEAEAKEGRGGKKAPEDAKLNYKHKHSKVPRPALPDAVGYEVEVTATSLTLWTATPSCVVHSVDVSKGMMTVSYEVDEGAPPDLQEMDYALHLAWVVARCEAGGVCSQPEPALPCSCPCSRSRSRASGCIPGEEGSDR